MIGARIKQLRKDRGLTQEQLGALIHADQSVVSRLERDLMVPTVDRLHLIARATERPIEYLIPVAEADATPDTIDPSPAEPASIDVLIRLLQEVVHQQQVQNENVNRLLERMTLCMERSTGMRSAHEQEGSVTTIMFA
jgi:transcriptional regulator with XRE-family HTH domain